MTSCFSEQESRKKRSAESCPAISTAIKGCTPKEEDPGVFGFEFTLCLTPMVDKVTIEELAEVYKFTITGRGFGSDNCQHKVQFFGNNCEVQSASETSLVCHMRPHVSLHIGAPFPLNDNLEVRVKGRGIARNVIDGAQSFTFKPIVSSVTPLEGSVNGGTTLVIKGLALTDMVVILGSHRCDIKTKTASVITCITRPAAPGTKARIIIDKSTHSITHSETFAYTSAKTPTITGVSSSDITSLTDITITGTGFVTDCQRLEVLIGPGKCIPKTCSSTSIGCRPKDVVVGQYDLVVRLFDKGIASGSKKVTVTPTISTISPKIGSIKGGLKVIVNGDGFHLTSTEATIDGTTVTVKDTTHTSFTLQTKDHAAGTVDLIIKSNSITYPTQRITFATASTPSVSALKAVNDGIEVTGTKFPTSINDVHVKVCGKSCKIVSSASTKIKIEPCYHCPPGAYQISVHVVGLGFAAVDDTVKAFLADRKPSISSFTPTEGKN